MEIKIGGVPEHFNTPLHIAKEQGQFLQSGFNVELISCPGGTGEMIEGLKTGRLDMVMALTEGLVASIAKGADEFQICGTYVASPLTWVVSSGSNSPYTNTQNLKGAKIGISRYGSGSHIMAYVLCEELGWLSSDDLFQFTVLNNFTGLRNGVNNGDADAFLWERFTTKPYHDSGEIRSIGQIAAPWCAFLMAARKDLLDSHGDQLNSLLDCITQSCRTFIQNKHQSSIDYVAKMHNQRRDDVEKWFESLAYADDCKHVSRSMLEKCNETLLKANVITQAAKIDDLCYKNVKLI
ncbi:4-amino-5-hydroxymethyl-2-methylpyrimidine phosphate synthase [Trichoplax sp. H2]|uniref:Ca3427-like PBP 2 domain-containing protein n=1 Tax=Trichoplax adhaerens TaxID=10228 RepID=B3SCK1_TRIAD|nr:hypothetical protein TRIADDRAFT_33295 [Trichoplax adhaerens]EDV19550.1 hypothetical protein TRIADDRAFT_33295 [Trichoplax adhaerens]RDD40635.1 4-amino-5-hydroxymethyl-2-methylpyrimidine phosphate synthase [Trichoplax sp. H2]|eukprot:XP_002117982.1 hypothetical protein TRIADDRAFT_33295 [Trichoplax adhaerens]